jgi:uncharacterized protein (DUF1810 family)
MDWQNEMNTFDYLLESEQDQELEKTTLTLKVSDLELIYPYVDELQHITSYKRYKEETESWYDQLTTRHPDSVFGLRDRLKGHSSVELFRRYLVFMYVAKFGKKPPSWHHIPYKVSDFRLPWFIIKFIAFKTGRTPQDIKDAIEKKERSIRKRNSKKKHHYVDSETASRQQEHWIVTASDLAMRRLVTFFVQNDKVILEIRRHRMVTSNKDLLLLLENVSHYVSQPEIQDLFEDVSNAFIDAIDITIKSEQLINDIVYDVVMESVTVNKVTAMLVEAIAMEIFREYLKMEAEAAHEWLMDNPAVDLDQLKKGMYDNIEDDDEIELAKQSYMAVRNYEEAAKELADQILKRREFASKESAKIYEEIDEITAQTIFFYLTDKRSYATKDNP